MTNPGEELNQREDVQRVSREVANKLGELGIWLSGDETPDDLVQIIEAVERFEVAVQTRGGDLMVDEGPDGNTTQPDDVHFALPQRRADESVARYVERLEQARNAVLEHPTRD